MLGIKFHVRILGGYFFVIVDIIFVKFSFLFVKPSYMCELEAFFWTLMFCQKNSKIMAEGWPVA